MGVGAGAEALEADLDLGRGLFDGGAHALLDLGRLGSRPKPKRTCATSSCGVDAVQTPPSIRPTVIPYGRSRTAAKIGSRTGSLISRLDPAEPGHRPAEAVERTLAAGEHRVAGAARRPTSRAQTTPVHACPRRSPVGSPISTASAS